MPPPVPAPFGICATLFNIMLLIIIPSYILIPAPPPAILPEIMLFSICGFGPFLHPIPPPFPAPCDNDIFSIILLFLISGLPAPEYPAA